MANHTRIVVDLETIPDQREGAATAARSRITAPANYKDPAKIEAYIEGKAQEAWRATSLNGSYGEIFCIGFGLSDEPVQVLYREQDEGREGERRLLEAFWDALADDLATGAQWIGHNILRFDLRFIWQRSVIHQVPIPRRIPFDASPWSPEVADTMLIWTGERNSYIKLDDLLDILGIESRDPISGAEVWDAIEAGGERQVIEHCVRNVEETREAWRRMMIFPEGVGHDG